MRRGEPAESVEGLARLVLARLATCALTPSLFYCTQDSQTDRASRG
jgi:hypothetical protein